MPASSAITLPSIPRISTVAPPFPSPYPGRDGATDRLAVGVLRRAGYGSRKHEDGDLACGGTAPAGSNSYRVVRLDLSCARLGTSRSGHPWPGPHRRLSHHTVVGTVVDTEERLWPEGHDGQGTRVGGWLMSSTLAVRPSPRRRRHSAGCGRPIRRPRNTSHPIATPSDRGGKPLRHQRCLPMTPPFIR